MAIFEKKTATIAGKTVTYHVAGEGTPLLALHSAYGVRLAPALELLADTCQVFVPVMPGFDGTEADDGLHSMVDLADLSAAFIDAKIGKSCDVIGHSFGGYIAAWLAVRHPARVQQLVLHASAGFRPEGAGGLVADPEKLRALMFAHPEKLPPEQKPLAVLGANRTAAHGYSGGIARDHALVAELGGITAQTLIVHGVDDGIVPLEAPRLLKERIPKSRLIYVYDAAHSVDTDQPERFCRLVNDFLSRGEAFIINWGREAQPA